MGFLWFTSLGFSVISGSGKLDERMVGLLSGALKLAA